MLAERPRPESPGEGRPLVVAAWGQVSALKGQVLGFDPHPTAGKRGGGKEIRGVGGIAAA